MQGNASTDDGENPNAISLFGQAANANDFPVLKAFQEYIDAEQAKARKRMLGLSIFFVVLLVAVVVTFTIVLISIFTHNRELSDRLLDVAFRERERQTAVQQPLVQPVVTPVVASAPDAGIKPILEKLDALATALATRHQQALQPAPVVVTTVPSAVAPPSPVESPETQQMREMIRKQQTELEAERNRLKETEEKLRKAEIERHRRRLYPEYYTQQDAPVPPPDPAPVAVPVQPKPTPVPASPPISAPAREKIQEKTAHAPKSAASPATPLRNLKAIDYFARDEDDELTPRSNPPIRQELTPTTAPSSKKATPPSAKKQPPPASQAKKAASAPATKTEPSPAKKETSVLAKKPPPPPSAVKTKTLDVNTSSDNSIPWLIEDRDL